MNVDPYLLAGVVVALVVAVAIAIVVVLAFPRTEDWTPDRKKIAELRRLPQTRERLLPQREDGSF